MHEQKCRYAPIGIVPNLSHEWEFLVIHVRILGLQINSNGCSRMFWRSPCSHWPNLGPYDLSPLSMLYCHYSNPILLWNTTITLTNTSHYITLFWLCAFRATKQSNWLNTDNNIDHKSSQKIRLHHESFMCKHLLLTVCRLRTSFPTDFTLVWA